MQDRWVLMKNKILKKSGLPEIGNTGSFHSQITPTNSTISQISSNNHHELSITNTKSTKTVIEMRYPPSGGAGSNSIVVGSNSANASSAVEIVTTQTSGVSSIPVGSSESSEFATNLTDFANDFDQEECYEWVSCKLVSHGFDLRFRIFTTRGLDCLWHTAFFIGKFYFAPRTPLHSFALHKLHEFNIF